MRQLIKPIASFLLIAGIFYFLIDRLYKSYSQISGYDFMINWPLMTFSFLFSILFFLLMGYAWKQCLGIFGSEIPKFHGVYYWCKSQLGKYLPGTVWYMIGRMHFLSKHNTPKQDAFASMIIEMVFLADASLLFSIILLNNQIAKVINIYLALSIVIFGLLLIHPKLLNFIFSKFKIVEVRLKKSYFRILSLFALYVVIVSSSSLGFYLFSKSIYPSLNMIYVMGSFSLAYFFGLVAFFAPGGLGVREGILSLMLSAVMPLPLAIIISFAARIWWTVAELSSIIIGKILIRLD